MRTTAPRNQCPSLTHARTVWTIAPRDFNGHPCDRAHFALKLARRDCPNQRREPNALTTEPHCFTDNRRASLLTSAECLHDSGVPLPGHRAQVSRVDKTIPPHCTDHLRPSTLTLVDCQYKSGAPLSSKPRPVSHPCTQRPISVHTMWPRYCRRPSIWKSDACPYTSGAALLI